VTHRTKYVVEKNVLIDLKYSLLSGGESGLSEGKSGLSEPISVPGGSTEDGITPVPPGEPVTGWEDTEVGLVLRIGGNHPFVRPSLDFGNVICQA
jgi:hypothetical protein